MRARRFEWEGAAATAATVRDWAAAAAEPVDVASIEREVREGGDGAVLRLSARLDPTATLPPALRVDPSLAAAALERLDSGLRKAIELAVANVRAVAEAQLSEEHRVELPQGQSVRLRELPVGAAGIYAPGGRAAYPSSVVMCAVPARVAGVDRIALASPPGPAGTPHPLVLAAAALCGVEEIYAMGGAQAIFALAYGTESVAPVDVIAGPGNAWVREAKRAVYGQVGIDSLAGPSELMVIAGHDSDPDWIALDLCAQAEHGADSPLLVAGVEEHVLDAIEAAAEGAAADRPSVADAPLAIVAVPDLEAAADLANAFAPEHLELFDEDAPLLAERIRTAGCVFAGRHAATAFGDYLAGSNHVLPTGGAARFASALSPRTFRRTMAEVRLAPSEELSRAGAAIARAEGFVAHAESMEARIRDNGRHD
jgi:histidinol dehydrogenase